MKARIVDIEALQAVSTLSLHAYLKAQGWQRGDDLGDRGVVYFWSDETEIFAPGTIMLADYPSSVAAVIEALSVVEERSEISIFRDLATADHDLIRFRAPDAEGDGSIPINSGVDLFQRSRDALLAAACSAASPRRFFRAFGNREATDYLERVRLGQTEQGSFVVTLVSPVPPSLEDTRQPSFWPEFSVEPFERKVTRTLSDALKAVREAISDVSRGSDIEAFERSVTRGVSANLCDALSGLIGDGNGLEISLSWARTRPTPESRTLERFDESEIEVLREAARLLREKEPRPNERLEGFVTRLARDVNAIEGTVTLKALIDGDFKSVRVNLDPTLYEQAVNAHTSRQRLALEGDLERQGQRWRLVSPRHVEVLPEEDTEEDEISSIEEP